MQWLLHCHSLNTQLDQLKKFGISLRSISEKAIPFQQIDIVYLPHIGLEVVLDRYLTVCFHIHWEVTRIPED